MRFERLYRARGRSMALGVTLLAMTATLLWSAAPAQAQGVGGECSNTAPGEPVAAATCSFTVRCDVGPCPFQAQLGALALVAPGGIGGTMASSAFGTLETCAAQGLQVLTGCFDSGAHSIPSNTNMTVTCSTFTPSGVVVPFGVTVGPRVDCAMFVPSSASQG